MSFKGFVDSIQAWYESIWGKQGQAQSAVQTMPAFETIEALNTFYNGLNPEVRKDAAVMGAYTLRASQIADIHTSFRDPLADFIETTLDKWIAAVGNLENLDPDAQKKKLADITAKIIELFGASAVIDVGLGMLPNSAGEASATNSKELLKWLGFGAVLAAVAHDPVKIGLLRPYQDSLEATFRNKRPEAFDILNAFKQRSLSETVITNIDEITDPVMDKIEDENNTNLYAYLAQHGYKDSWITILKDASTKALTFGNLASMARMGHYNRQLAIFSLWTYGLDRRLMYQSLDALETMRDVGLWKGFRSMVEPSYVQGLIDADDLKEYWSRILVPEPVQEWALLRLTKSRQRYATKELKLEGIKQRDLTRADYEKAYVEGLIDISIFHAKLLALGYDEDETALIIKLSDLKKVGPKTEKCKHLPLSDYELAHRNGLVTADRVLDRMRGEYCEADIELEKQLIAIDDLTSDAPARERDLTVSQVTEAFTLGYLDRTKLSEYLAKLGYDEEETGYLVSLAEVKKGIAAAKAAKTATTASITRERDLTVSQVTQAYILGIESKEDTGARLASLGYDAAEVSIIMSISDVKKGMKAPGGLKRLPLSDYEKAAAYGLITNDDVLARMKGEYDDFDIGLEKLMLVNGIAGKG